MAYYNDPLKIGTWINPATGEGYSGAKRSPYDVPADPTTGAKLPTVSNVNSGATPAVQPIPVVPTSNQNVQTGGQTSTTGNTGVDLNQFDNNDPLRKFNLAILDMLKKAQAGETAMSQEQAQLKREAYRSGQEVFSGQDALMSPDAKMATLNRNVEMFNPSIQAATTKINQLRDITDLMKTTYGEDFSKMLPVSEEDAQTFKLALQAGMTLPADILEKYKKFFTTEDFSAWAEANKKGTTGTREDLNGMELLQARNLSVKIFGKRGGILPENIGLIEDLMAKGMTPDQIEDQLRYSSESTGFTGATRDAAESIAVGMTSTQAEQFFNSLDRSLEDENTERVKEILMRGALDSLGGEEAKKVRGDQRAVELFNSIADDLREYESKGGDTNIFSGNYEKVMERIGKTSNKELAALANKIQMAIQTYRKSISGAAFTESESKEYQAIFPSIDKTSSLNFAKIESAKEVLQGNVDFLLKSMMGSQAFDEIFGKGEEQGGNSYQSSNGNTYILPY
jgi:ElaB/YqjD/DUF883 family membrane-anchored ribosome-binding protein